jgi:NTE family protein
MLASQVGSTITVVVANALSIAARVLDVIDPYNVKRVLELVNELRHLAAVSADVSFLRHARRATLPLPVIDRPQAVDGDVFPPFRARPVEGLRDKRVAIITSGGSGGCVALVGVARAFEEAGIKPALISCCSGSVIWGAMWAAGLTAQEMADFSLSWQPEAYLDIQWARLPRFLFSALRDFTGLAKGEAIQRLFDRQAWSRPVGELEIPLSTIVYDMDLGEVEYFGTANTPELTVGELVRIGIALPVFIEAVSVRGHLHVDGGIIDLFPAAPVIADPSIDYAFGVNFMLPPGFEPQNVTGWQTHRLGILQASRQLQQGYQLELARRSQRQLGDRLTLIDPIDYALLRGVSFYDLFIDRRHWPELIRRGYQAARRTLQAFPTTNGSLPPSPTIARRSRPSVRPSVSGAASAGPSESP